LELFITLIDAKHPSVLEKTLPSSGNVPLFPQVTTSLPFVPALILVKMNVTLEAIVHALDDVVEGKLTFSCVPLGKKGGGSERTVDVTLRTRSA
jgi:hypothetical protein